MRVRALAALVAVPSGFSESEPVIFHYQALAAYAFDSAVNPTSAVVLDVADMAAEVIAEKPLENAARAHRGRLSSEGFQPPPRALIS